MSQLGIGCLPSWISNYKICNFIHFIYPFSRTEAQLKYSNAITSSGIGPVFYAGAEQAEERREEQAQQQLQRRTEVQRRYKKRSEGTKSGTAGATTAAENEDANATRTEFFSYFLSLLRSAAAENGKEFGKYE